MAGLAECADIGSAAGSASSRALHAGESRLVESWSASREAGVFLEQKRGVADVAAGGAVAVLAASGAGHALSAGVDEPSLWTDTGSIDEVEVGPAGGGLGGRGAGDGVLRTLGAESDRGDSEVISNWAAA